jgi:hypothetical protein
MMKQARESRPSLSKSTALACNEEFRKHNVPVDQMVAATSPENRPRIFSERRDDPLNWYQPETFKEACERSIAQERADASKTPNIKPHDQALKTLSRSISEPTMAPDELFECRNASTTTDSPRNSRSRSCGGMQSSSASENQYVFQHANNISRAKNLPPGVDSTSTVRHDDSLDSASDDAVPDFYDVHTSQGVPEKKERSSLLRSVRKIQNWMLKDSTYKTTKTMEVHTYVHTRSRMMHHSHGQDGSIIDMF